MKKVISIILAIVTIMSLFTVTSNAVIVIYGETEEGEETKMVEEENPWGVFLTFRCDELCETHLSLYLFDKVTQSIVEVNENTPGADAFDVYNVKRYSWSYPFVQSGDFIDKDKDSECETDEDYLNNGYDRYTPYALRISFKVDPEIISDYKKWSEVADEETYSYKVNMYPVHLAIVQNGERIPLNFYIEGFDGEDKTYNVGVSSEREGDPIVNEEENTIDFVYGTLNEETGEATITENDRYEGSFLFVNKCYSEDAEHEWGEWTTDDTVKNCLNKTEYTRYCMHCGKKETKTETNACSYVLHSCVAPSCKDKGYKIYVCSLCGGEKIEYLDKLEHEYDEWVEYPATCTTASHKTRTCKNCGNTETIYSGLPNGHDYEVKEIIDPTCDTYGYCTFKCKHCNDTYVNIIGKLPKEEPIVEETTEEITTEETTTVEETTEEIATKEETTIEETTETTNAEETTVVPEQTTNIVEDTTVTETKKTSKNIFDYIADFFKWLMNLFN